MVDIAAATMKFTGWQGDNGVIKEGASPSENNDGVAFKGVIYMIETFVNFLLIDFPSRIHTRTHRGARADEKYQLGVADSHSQLRLRSGENLILRVKGETDMRVSIMPYSSWRRQATTNTRLHGWARLKDTHRGANWLLWILLLVQYPRLLE